MSTTAEAAGASTQKDRLRVLLARDAFCERDVSLSSGSASKYYFDCKRVMLTPKGADLVGQACLDELNDWPVPVQAVGGLAAGAVPMVSAIIMKSGKINGFFVRPEPKKHGLMRLIENPPPAGTNVVVVDDVVTSGSSLLRAARAAGEAGCNVVGALTLVDRNDGGAERIRQEIPRYVSLFTKDRDFPDPIA